MQDDMQHKYYYFMRVGYDAAYIIDQYETQKRSIGSEHIGSEWFERMDHEARARHIDSRSVIADWKEWCKNGEAELARINAENEAELARTNEEIEAKLRRIAVAWHHAREEHERGELAEMTRLLPADIDFVWQYGDFVCDPSRPPHHPAP